MDVLRGPITYPGKTPEGKRDRDRENAANPVGHLSDLLRQAVRSQEVTPYSVPLEQ